LIGDEPRAEEELSNGIAEFRAATSEQELTDYESSQLALSLELLGAIRQDEKLLKEAVDLFEQLLESGNFTSTGRAELYRHMGDAHRHKRAWNLAREAYLRALDIESPAICKVLLAECVLRMNGTDDAIKLITEVDVRELGQSEYVDYVFAAAEISIEAKKRELLEKVRSMLSDLEVSGPYFRERRDSLLLSVIETQQSRASQPTSHRTKRILTGLARHASSYLVLQPNFMGIGLNVGRMLEKLAIGEEEHSSRAADERLKRGRAETPRRVRQK
jgi:tetratricopeptide (TPR) repeat protein